MTNETNNVEVEPLSILQAEFSTLDSALIAAILSDTNSLTEARQTLNILKPQTVLDDYAVPGPDSCPELGGEGSSETDLTWQTEENEEENPPDKLESLRNMFPELRLHTLKRVLNSAQGEVDRAIDELLNRALLDGDDEGGRKIGVDAFDVELGLRRVGRKGKRKGWGNGNAGGGKRAGSLQSGNSTSDRVAESRWESLSREVDYLANCLGLERGKVQYVHHLHNGSMGPTIVALLDRHATVGGDSHDATHLEELSGLSAEFGEAVKIEHLDKLLSLCKENKTAVFELAEIISRDPPKHLTVSLPPPPPSFSSSSSLSTPTSRPRTKPRPTNPTTEQSQWTTIGPNPRSPTSASHTSAAAHAAAYANQRNEAFAKARAAHQKSKSNHLMSGAAAVYSEQGHEYGLRAKLHSDQAAELLVEQNSNLDTLDLHGATVKQAVKISREKTTQWWVRENNRGGREGRRGEGVRPLYIVTGCGRHSKDGNPVLLPAVSKMLMREGWNIQVSGGQVAVLGVRAGAGR